MSKKEIPRLKRVRNSEDQKLEDIFGPVVYDTYEGCYDHIMSEVKDIIEYREEIGDPYGVHKAVEYAIREINKLNNYSWTETSEMPKYDGEYLCKVEIPQECGNTWHRQTVIMCKFNKWEVEDGINVTHWRGLPEPPKTGLK